MARFSRLEVGNVIVLLFCLFSLTVEGHFSRLKVDFCDGSSIQTNTQVKRNFGSGRSTVNFRASKSFSCSCYFMFADNEFCGNFSRLIDKIYNF